MQNRSLTRPTKAKDITPNSFKLPGGIKTSAQIIEDARRSVRLVPTSRPYTPADGRNLFGNNNRTTSRPPSTVSLGQSTNYIDESVLQVRSAPRKFLVLEPIRQQVSVPPTPVQSVVDINPISPYVTPTNQKLPELKISKSSPTISKRIDSAERREREDSWHSIKSGSGQSEGQVTPERVMSGSNKDAVIEWERTIIPLMELLEKESNVEKIKEYCDSLWTALQDGGFVGQTAGHAGKNRRSNLLRCLFRLLSHKDTTVLAKVLKILLPMKMVGGNLLKVCQRTFLLSKEESNDEILIKENIAGPLVEILLTMDPLTETNTVIYGLGAVKSLSCNQILCASLRAAGVVEMLATYLNMSCQNDPKMPSSVIVQLITCLRNLSDNANIYADFLTNNILTFLSKILSIYKDDTEIVFCISRLISKLSLHTDCNYSLSQCEGFIAAVPELITTHNNNQDIIVRLYFILGNLTSTNTSFSYTLYHTHTFHQSINKTLNHYYENMNNNQTDPNTTSELTNNLKITVDVLIKVVRLIANICVHQNVAHDLFQETEILKILLKITGHYSVSEELVTNTLVAFNNLSYHVESSDKFNIIEEELTTVIIDLLLINNDQLLLECVRVLGNISKRPLVRNMIAINKVNELLITILDSNKLELVFSSCGVLINLMVDQQHKDILKINQGTRKLVDVLSHFGRQDWQLSGIVCKILWNYYSGSQVFDEDERTNIVHLLEEFLDPVTAFTAYMLEEDSSSDEDNISNGGHEPSAQAHSFWENEFSPVANMLMKKLQSNSS